MRLRGELAPDNGADAIIAALGPVAAGQDWAGRGWRVPHRSTVNKILKRAGLVKDEPRKRPRSSFRRFAYARPRDCYQLDATEVKLAGGQAAVVFDVLDDCTRLLAACHAADAETGTAAVAAITAAAAAHGAPGIVLCDNGAALSGGLTRGQGKFARAVASLGSRLIHSSPYHPQTCGKVERHQCATRRSVVSPAQPGGIGGRFLGLMAYLDPKGEGDKSMPGNQWPGPGVRDGVLGDPRDMAKAGLPESQSPEDASSHPPERRLKPAPRPASG